MKNKLDFKEFLLCENKNYLGEKIGNILTAVQDLNEIAPNIGTRQLIIDSENIVNQIRRILHSNWQKKIQKFLLPLQKIGVAIMAAIEEKDDLKEILKSVQASLEKLLTDMGVPVNDLSVPEKPLTDSPENDTMSPDEQPPPAST